MNDQRLTVKEPIHPNWVAERAKCDIGRMFADVCDLVKLDVERMCAVIDHKESESASYMFIRPRNKSHTCLVRRLCHLEEIGSCLFTYADDGIRVTRTEQATPVSLTLRTHWNAEESRCLLVIDAPGKDAVVFPHDHLWKAIQYILEPFFFPPA